ncbi:Hydroxymethylglutaryl-coenzyme A synthase C terminal [Aspergillus parasiticus SU-1]|uniref:Hydroxymethylglutaryl-coenzyme A synthase C terminal n=1 Tax=Aspergillus parasiticus (strain ATCC 56775 / NRRL 5862 / SRRC 143 / SU-1) TaxID=1403190 RepID=A0A0F0IN73_ASPPU|nr:Hydroxymethylglutaryl-coenzyme A synthase C terminal [Aspergillus parasiticus SU-1]
MQLNEMPSTPQNIGIKAIEIYFPSRYVPQSELEKFLGVSAGKFTIGLGQQKMSFCDDREDRFDPVPSEIRDVEYTASLTNKSIEKLCMGLTKDKFSERVQPSLTAPAYCGNMYTASIYSGLVSLLSNVPSEKLQNKRVGMFSYGGGLASTMFSLQVKGDITEMAQKIRLRDRLDARAAVSPEFYDQMCQLREKAYQQKNYTPKGSVDSLAPGTYYLIHVDDIFRRKYELKPYA